MLYFYNYLYTPPKVSYLDQSWSNW